MKLKLKTLKSNIFQLLLLSFFCIVVVIALIVYSQEKDFTIGKLANLGDFFGGILNPIFAFLAFLALLVTIILQATELKATRKELRKSSKAQKKQSKSLKLQNKATKLQMFENTFFQLISIFIELKSNFTVSHWERLHGIKNGQPTSNTIVRNMTFHETIQRFLEDLKGQCSGDYEKFNNTHESVTGSYFAQTYQIIKFVDESSINDKQKYINIFRAQFSKAELELLFYHCLGSIGKRKFKELVERYEFFEHITHNDDIDKSISNYKITAFGKNEKLKEKHKDYAKS